jgi:hypothetical protein
VGTVFSSETPKGVKSFAFAYRSKATRKVEWLTFGRYPDVARKIAAASRRSCGRAQRGDAHGCEANRSRSRRASVVQRVRLAARLQASGDPHQRDQRGVPLPPR